MGQAPLLLKMLKHPHRRKKHATLAPIPCECSPLLVGVHPPLHPFRVVSLPLMPLLFPTFLLWMVPMPSLSLFCVPLCSVPFPAGSSKPSNSFSFSVSFSPLPLLLPFCGAPRLVGGPLHPFRVVSLSLRTSFHPSFVGGTPFLVGSLPSWAPLFRGLPSCGAPLFPVPFPSGSFPHST